MTFYSFSDRGRIWSRNRHVPYRPRYRWGLSFGLAAAVVYSLIAAIVALGKGQTYFARYDVTLWQIVLTYFVAGAACGLALAFLYPLASHRWGSFLLGFLLGTIVYGTVGIALIGFHAFALVIALVPGVLIGGGLGLYAFSQNHPSVE